MLGTLALVNNDARAGLYWELHYGSEQNVSSNQKERGGGKNQRKSFFPPKIKMFFFKNTLFFPQKLLKNELGKKDL